MEEAKAASYELTRKGEGAGRFKQGLGFSSSSSFPLPSKTSSSSSSLFSKFVRATSPAKAEKQAQLQTIQAKLRKSHRSSSSDHRCRSPARDGTSSRERRRERARVCRSRSRDRRRRSRSWSEEEGEDREGHYRSRNGSRRRSRSRSPSRVSSSRDLKKDRGREEGRRRHGIAAEKGDGLDYVCHIEGYSQMTPAERVRVKMKLQLSQTAANDSTMGMSSGWERFDFNKDAPLDDDDDDEIDVAEDDASLVKEIGNSFRYSAVQAKREEQIKAAHDEAMFGASAMAPTIPDSDTYKDEKKMDCENQNNNLISDKVLALQRGSWRDRIGRFKSGSD